MRRASLIALAGVAGAALAGGYLVARPDQDRAPDLSAARPTPVLRVSLDRAAAPMQVRDRGIAATARIVAREHDPAGGPDWVLRTYKRAKKGRGGQIWCAQLGRLIDGQVAWVEPGEHRARRLPLGDAGTTSCATTAPISERLGVNVGGFPDGDPGDPATRVRTAVAWGVVDRTVASAAIERSTLAGPVDIVRHGFLRVQESDGAPPAVRLVVRDTGGGRRAAIPLGAFSDLPVPNPRRGVPAPAPGVPADQGRSATGDRFTIVAKTSPDRVGVVSALYAMRVPGRSPCVSSPVDTIGGRPAQTWYQGNVGLVRSPLIQCQFLPEAADARPIGIGGGSQSGFDPDYGVRAAADRRSLVERRRPPAMATEVIATPAGTRYLEVRSPVGVTTVRVGWARVTVVRWDGQPEVIRAMYPQYRKVNGRTTRIGGNGITLRALDARGQPVGRAGRLPPAPSMPRPTARRAVTPAPAP